MVRKYRRCCGSDVHKESVEVCVLPPVGMPGHLSKRLGAVALVAQAVEGERDSHGVDRGLLATGVAHPS